MKEIAEEERKLQKKKAFTGQKRKSQPKGDLAMLVRLGPSASSSLSSAGNGGVVALFLPRTASFQQGVLSSSIFLLLQSVPVAQNKASPPSQPCITFFPEVFKTLDF